MISNRKNESNGSGSGVGFGGLLALVFITLKLVGTINWSWWWVLSPIWIPLIIVFIVMTVVICRQ
jgi:hypothetical protein